MSDYNTKDLTRTVPSNKILKVKEEGSKDEKKKYIPLDKRVYSTPMEARKAADDEDRANLREIRSVEDKSKKSTKTTKTTKSTEATKSKAKNPKFYGYTNITKY
jgi:hypothetical protein